MARTDLTPSEGAVIGHPGDLVDEDRVPARPKSSTVMFSLRVDRQTFEALSDIAEERGRRFSDVARDALHVYVDRPTDAASYRLLEAIAAKVGVQTAERETPYVSEASQPRIAGRRRSPTRAAKASKTT